jgi:hypothetical protein
MYPRYTKIFHVPPRRLRVLVQASIERLVRLLPLVTLASIDRESIVTQEPRAARLQKSVTSRCEEMEKNAHAYQYTLSHQERICQ